MKSLPFTKHLFVFLLFSFLIINNGFAQWKQTSLSGSSVHCIAINGDRIFAGTFGSGLYLSTNKGESWTAKNNGLTNSYFWSIAIYGDTIFAGSTSEAGIFRSIDNGENWQAANKGLNTNNEFAIAISGTNILAAPAMAGIYLSANNGDSWTSVSDGIAEQYPAIKCFAKNSDYIVAGSSEGIYVSSNNGKDWVGLYKSPHYVESLAINGDYIYAGTELGIFISKDNGKSWTEKSNGLINKDVRSIAINGSFIFAGTQGGGVYLSTNNGESWTALNEGLTEKNVWTIAISGEYLFAGTDNGVWKYYFGSHVPICYVEFDTKSQKYNNIIWSTNTPAAIDSVYIFTEVSTNVWQRIGSVSSDKNNFIDSLSKPENQSYSYRIQALESNGNLSEASQPHTTITLTEAHNTNAYGFTWTLYQGLTIPNYYLYGIKADGKDSLIVSLAGNKTAYNYTNPYPNFVKFFVGFYASQCAAKSNHLVKSNFVEGTTGIENNHGIKNLFYIYPNLANSLIVVICPLIGNKPVNISIYDIIGKEVKSQNSKGKSEIRIDTSELIDGVYFVRVTGENMNESKKIIIRHE